MKNQVTSYNNPFHEMSDRFQQNIYQSFKGKIRIEVIKTDLENHLKSKLDILDIGAGSGMMALELARQGHNLTLLEPVADLLNTAQQQFNNMNLHAQFHLNTYENIPYLFQQQFDLICIHAVLEWLEQPFDLLNYLKPLLKPQGKLSLAFYNKDGLILHNLIRGNLKIIAKNFLTERSGGLTPINPLNYDDVIDVLKQHKLKVIDQSAIRSFHDYMPKTTRAKISENDLILHELKHRKNLSFVRIARYIHIIAEQY